VTFVTVHQRRDGTHYPVEVHLQFFDRGGDQVFLAVIQDITERKRAEEALRESEAVFRNLFEGRAAVKLLIDPGGGAIVDANEAAARFYGWSRDQLKRMRIQVRNGSSFEGRVSHWYRDGWSLAR
jgi:PAS domain-containing protein